MKPTIRPSKRDGFRFVASYGNQECHAHTEVEAYNNLIVAVGVGVIYGSFEVQDKVESSDIEIGFGIVANAILTDSDYVRVKNINGINIGKASKLKIAGNENTFNIVAHKNNSGIGIDIIVVPEIDSIIHQSATVWFYE